MGAERGEGGGDPVVQSACVGVACVRAVACVGVACVPGKGAPGATAEGHRGERAWVEELRV